MLKKIANFMVEKGLACEKDNFYGIIDGIEISGIAPTLSSATLSFAAHVPYEAAGNINSWIEGNKRLYGIVNYTLDKMGLYLIFSPNITVKKYLACFDVMFNVMRQNSVGNSCPFCGERLESFVYVDINGRRMHAHESCFNDYMQYVAQTEAAKAAIPVKPVRGVIGALIGSILGCILWAILYFVGYVAIIAAILTALGAAFMWDKFGGKNCKAKVVTIWIVTLVMLSATMFVCYLILVEAALIEYNQAGTSIEWFIKLMNENAELRTAIIFDTAISYILIIVGNIFTTVRILRSQRLESTGIRRLQ